ncbi:MAG: prohibitin family protein [Candidatus Kapabacteria bacterium]|nr:prohibitin family protein [Candidatus Kapabacteria bacterium]
MSILFLGIIVFLVGFIVTKIQSPLMQYKSIIKIIGLILIIVGALSKSLVIVDPGEIGVQVLFGQVKSDYLSEGMNIINPLMDVKHLNVKTLNYTMSATHDEGQKQGDDAIRILSRDGLEVAIDLTVLYRINSSQAPNIMKTIGLNFEENVIRPIIRTRIRESAVSFNAIELYSTKREIFEGGIKLNLEKDLLERGFILERILVRKTMLPNSVKESIERKINAEQDAERMKYVLQKETQEAERKRVEAKGIADGQKIMSENLNDKILQYEMIKAQKEIALSNNSKIIIVGNSKGSTPFIIGHDK